VQLWRASGLALTSEPETTLVGAFSITERSDPLAKDLLHGPRICLWPTKFEGEMRLNEISESVVTCGHGVAAFA
ncbi:hypothetical protein ACFU6S_44730, partial [Streptomyces sp. NPDC057456]|uniref:hypothetical protein n=1 Tax=Streptomyces sp. NPDC057456 TaxID=3346139 RepID=UPI00369A24DD